MLRENQYRVKETKSSKMLSRKFIRPILHKIYDNVSVSAGRTSIYSFLRFKCNSMPSIIFSILKWWRNGIVSTPLCTNSNIFGPPYRETSPHSMRMSSTNSICRDINSAGINKFGVAGPGEFFDQHNYFYAALC